MSNSESALLVVQCWSVKCLIQNPLFFLAPMEEIAPEEARFLVEDMKRFLEGGYFAPVSNGARRPNWADASVLVDLTLLNQLITKENVETFYKSCVGQMKQQKITGKKNIVIFSM